MILLLFWGSLTTLGQPAGEPSHSIARIWNERLLEAIRHGFARPTVHARNLFHTSIAMWDSWAAYDPAAKNYLHQEKAQAPDPGRPRRITLSYACYRILSFRFAGSPGADDTLPALDAQMEALGYDIGFTDVEGDSPTALGNRIAASVLAFGAADGSNEENGFENRFYEPVNPPLVPILPGNPDILDPNRWQPLALDVFIFGMPPFLSRSGAPSPPSPWAKTT